jgi:hypothetical protein
MLSNKTYDFVKRLVQVILPATSSLYFGLAAIWGLPAAEQVVGTFAVVTTFLGVTLGISSKVYSNSDEAYDGNLIVTSPQEGKHLYSLEVNTDPAELVDKKSITFKVQSSGVDA